MGVLTNKLSEIDGIGVVLAPLYRAWIYTDTTDSLLTSSVTISYCIIDLNSVTAT